MTAAERLAAAQAVIAAAKARRAEERAAKEAERVRKAEERAAKEAAKAAAPPPVKRPVGRPRKIPPPTDTVTVAAPGRGTDEIAALRAEMAELRAQLASILATLNAKEETV